MAETQPLTFVLSDESVNSYGTRVITAGVDLSLFKKNPIMLWNHFRTWKGTTDEVLPIGHWENIRKEGDRILADAVFDEKDDFAQKIKSKVEQGIIKMASVGIDIIATSEDKAVLMQGQTRPTIVKCLIKEASVCDIASNRNALRLYDEYGDEITFADGRENHLLPLLELTTNNQNTMNFNDQIATVLGLTQTPTETQLLASVQTVISENANLKAEVTQFKADQSARLTAERDTYLKEAVTDRKILQSQVAQYEKLYDADPAATRSIVDALAAVADLSDAANPQSTPEPGSAWDKKLRETGQIQK